MSLADSLRDWRPGTVEMERRVDPWPAAAFAGMIGAPEPALREGDPLPPMWHWFTLLEHPERARIGPDGHLTEGALVPPVPGRRRMFAGGRLHVQAPIAVGSLLRARSEVSGVAIKQGRGGEMAFVTVRTELHADDVPVAVEEQDIVYRSQPEGAPVRTLARPEGSLPEPGGDWRSVLATDPVLLFRFSALTYNGHRIHYDRPYATGEEGYPDLVIHGPLLALLALELPRVHAPGRTVTAFEYRLVRPAFVPAPVIATGTVTSDGKDEVALAVGAAGVEPSLTAKARLG
jgi:3-methylfumaryl-CoA hydratase